MKIPLSPFIHRRSEAGKGEKIKKDNQLEEAVLKKYCIKDNKRKKQMKVSGSQVKRLQRIIIEKQ